jgi:Aspartyl protease
MRVLIIGVLLCCALVTKQSLAAGPKDCSLRRLTSIDLTVGPSGPVLLPVSIENTNELMILDTAQVFSFVWQDSADRLSLHKKSLPSGLAGTAFGNTRIDSYTTAPSLSMGSLRIGKADFLVIPEGADKYTGGNDSIVGVVGMNLLANVDIELDIAHHKLNLYSTDHCPGKVVYWSNTFNEVPTRRDKFGALSFPMELDGKKIEATLSSGNSQTSLSTDVTKRLYHFDATSPGVQAEGNSSGGTGAYYRAMELTAEGLRVTNARIALVDPRGTRMSTCELVTTSGVTGYSNCYGAYPLSLGFNILSRLHLYLATKEQRLYFTAAEAIR